MMERPSPLHEPPLKADNKLVGRSRLRYLQARPRESLHFFNGEEVRSMCQWPGEELCMDVWWGAQGQVNYSIITEVRAGGAARIY